VELGLEIGVGVPVGKSSSLDRSMLHVLGSQVPFGLELGALVTQRLYVGAFGSFALARTADQISVSTARYGVETRIRFRPGETIMPQLGYALGYESTSTARLSFSGFEPARLRAGADISIGADSVIGPLLDIAVGTYNRESGLPESGLLGGGADGSVLQRALHAWVVVGVRFAVVTWSPNA